MPDTYYVPMDYVRTNSLLYTHGKGKEDVEKKLEKRYMANGTRKNNE